MVCNDATAPRMVRAFYEMSSLLLRMSKDDLSSVTVKLHDATRSVISHYHEKFHDQQRPSRRRRYGCAFPSLGKDRAAEVLRILQPEFVQERNMSNSKTMGDLIEAIVAYCLIPDPESPVLLPVNAKLGRELDAFMDADLRFTEFTTTQPFESWADAQSTAFRLAASSQSAT